MYRKCWKKRNNLKTKKIANYGRSHRNSDPIWGRFQVACRHKKSPVRDSGNSTISAGDMFDIPYATVWGRRMGLHSNKEDGEGLSGQAPMHAQKICIWMAFKLNFIFYLDRKCLRLLIRHTRLSTAYAIMKAMLPRNCVSWRKKECLTLNVIGIY